jgi:hypothetical protein
LLTASSAVVETIYAPDCMSMANTGGLSASESIVSGSSTTATVTVALNNLDMAVWSIIDATQEQITFCYKSEIMIEVEQMNYVNTVVTAANNIENNIPTVTGLTIAASSDTVENSLAAAINFPLTADVCDGSNAPLDPVPPVSPGGSLKVCIRLPSSVAGVTLGTVHDALFTQAVTNVQSLAVDQALSQNTYTKYRLSHIYTLHHQDDRRWCLLCQPPGLGHDGYYHYESWSSYVGGPHALHPRWRS